MKSTSTSLLGKTFEDSYPNSEEYKVVRKIYIGCKGLAEEIYSINIHH